MLSTKTRSRNKNQYGEHKKEEAHIEISLFVSPKSGTELGLVLQSTVRSQASIY
jgi:hypothetical protein